MSIVVLQKLYCGEGIIDIEQDVGEALNSVYNPEMKKVPTDEHGIPLGEFKITIEWIPEEWLPDDER